MKKPDGCRACKNINCSIVLKYKSQAPKCPCKICLVKPVCRDNCKEFYLFLEDTYNNTTVTTHKNGDQVWVSFAEKHKR